MAVSSKGETHLDPPVEASAKPISPLLAPRMAHSCPMHVLIRLNLRSTAQAVKEGRHLVKKLDGELLDGEKGAEGGRRGCGLVGPR